jgi:type I restriction enzyme S subunit
LKVLIGDLGKVVTGRTPPTSGGSGLFGGEYPFITPTDIDGARYCETDRYISSEGAELLARILLPSESVCVVCIGATIGKICLTSLPSFTNQQINSVIIDRQKFDPKYVYYYLGTNVESFKKRAGGAATPILNKSSFCEIECDIPEFAAQRSIATILSAYDDLIENNTRRIAILEEMARLIYREWFVNFRFPSHENVKFVDSDLGKIPEGWEVKTVSDAFESFGGGTPSTKNESFWTGGTINWFTPTDLTAQKSMFAERSKDRITETGLKTSSARLFPPNAVMMTSRATIGAISICTSAACTNQGFITCIPNGLFPEYWIYFWLKENVNTFIMLSSGATFKEISRGTFRKIKLIGAPQRITKLFSENVTPICNLILNLSRQNKDLRQTRDLLLPRLISGGIDVSEMEITQSKDERSRKLSKNKVSR